MAARQPWPKAQDAPQEGEHTKYVRLLEEHIELQRRYMELKDGFADLSVPPWAHNDPDIDEVLDAFRQLYEAFEHLDPRDLFTLDPVAQEHVRLQMISAKRSLQALEQH